MMGNISRATSRGMRRWWRKRKELWSWNYRNGLRRIKRGKLTLKDITKVRNKGLVSKKQAEKLKQKLKERKKR